MRGFKSRRDFESWAYKQFEKHNVPAPETYSEQELVDLNPGVPVSFIQHHVKNRDKNV